MSDEKKAHGALAAAWGLWSRYTDGLGRHIEVKPEVIEKVVAAVAGESGTAEAPPRGTIAILRPGETHIAHVAHDTPVDWDILADGKIVAAGRNEGGALVLSGDLGVGVYRAVPRGGDMGRAVTIIMAPERAYQGTDGHLARSWVIAVQLYGIRSHNNWGHGDFGDLGILIDAAAQCGAGGIGLNPLHILFDDRPGHISPYSPNSRRFIDPLYINVEAVPGFPGIAALGLESEIAHLRAAEHVDYHGVRAAKSKALRASHAAFRRSGHPASRAAFDAYRAQTGASLRRFACFETLRRRFEGPWWTWPAPWPSPSEADLAAFAAEAQDEIDYYEYLQWIADQQIGQCRDQAAQRGLKVGLYIDLAVGVVPDGADAWSYPDAMLRGVSVGAPPDRINTQGQQWGLTTFTPAGLQTTDFAPYREMLEAAMRYAGAIRIDHVLGLNRLYIVPFGFSGADGTYIDFPVEALLAVAAEQSERHHCVVIGEDLGTVPDDFRERLARWGLWSYRVMQFERDPEGRFLPPQSYPPAALVTFTTHDLPTFAGWWSSHDLDVRHRLGIDPGESYEDRERARQCLREALSANGGTWHDGDLGGVAYYLGRTPSGIVSIPLEDILGLIEQPNLPGTIDQHPNWRQRMPVLAEDIVSHERLHHVADAMRATGRANDQ